MFKIIKKYFFRRNIFDISFSQLDFKERLRFLEKKGIFSKDEIQLLKQKSSLPKNLLNYFIENAIGYFPMPLGLAQNFKIDDRDVLIPMVVEENSIIAAASKTAKWVNQAGTITTKTLSQLAIGQIQFPSIKNITAFKEKILANKAHLMQLVNDDLAISMAKRGGGVKDIVIRTLDRGNHETMGIVHVLVDTCDAMGANIINQICEFLRPHLEELTQERVLICILSNLCDTKLTQATVRIKNIDPVIGNAIEEASLFAQLDPYRAATNNKGVMNAIDSVLIATGNDWRAVEAGVHAYAARSGKYTSITRWWMESNDLCGVIEAPIVAGTVGGVTTSHPIAKICLKLLNVHSASELSRIVAAVGLIQNLGALRALTTEGIVKGHMRLHLSNLLVAENVADHDIEPLKEILINRMKNNEKITSHHVKQLIAELNIKVKT